MEHPLIDKKRRFSFILITSLFALWGFANDITNPMVAAFQTLLELSAAKASLIQFAFYGGYATMAIPAALFIRKYSYKRGIQLGLLLYACGAFLFIPAAAYQEFSFFCLSLYILTFGLAFLETTANPFILSLGSKATSTRRLNLAQAFNPIGSLCGMAIASLIVLPQLISDQRDEAGAILYPTLSATEKAAIRLHDIAIIRDPYVALGLVVVAILVVVTVVKMPDVAEQKTKLDVKASLRRLWKNRLYRQGVVTQVFYVAAQIMVWTFIIQYADHLGIDKATAQMYNIVAMSLSLTGRFVGTWLMKYVSSPSSLSAHQSVPLAPSCWSTWRDSTVWWPSRHLCPSCSHPSTALPWKTWRSATPLSAQPFWWRPLSVAASSHLCKDGSSTKESCSVSLPSTSPSFSHSSASSSSSSTDGAPCAANVGAWNKEALSTTM